VFLQTGVRVGELCDLRLADVDLVAATLHVRGKGQVERTIRLESKGIRALKGWLAVRPAAGDDHLFLNQYGTPWGRAAYARSWEPLYKLDRWQAFLAAQGLTPHDEWCYGKEVGSYP
jgi:site-specific recombinase XerC